jgi:hypothetical protein
MAMDIIPHNDPDLPQSNHSTTGGFAGSGKVSSSPSTTTRKS